MPWREGPLQDSIPYIIHGAVARQTILVRALLH